MGFETLFNLNEPDMLSNGDKFSDVAHMRDAIIFVANSRHVEDRVILCIIMQESHGDVGIDTPLNSGKNPTPGLMQCVESPGFPGRHGLPSVSCKGMKEGE